ncbi:MAG: DUF711 family protein [Anaerolineaceae bacterium]|nr:DUF711 family protein [Anaerolineaceae bacterium]
MKIRSITCFFDPRTRSTQQTLDRMGKLAAAARDLYTNTGFEVQTTRLVTTPFPYLYPMDEVEGAVRMARQLEADSAQQGFDYVSIGPALTSVPSSYEMILPILASTKNVFVSAFMTTPNSEISLPAVKSCAKIITEAAKISPDGQPSDGFANLRFGALANVGPWGPFLPGAYHMGERPAFALAMECADAAYSAVRKAKSLAEARQNLITSFEAQATTLAGKANHLAQQYDVDFRGFDFSLAPFPEQWCSLGAALEALGLPALGMSGSLAAAAFMADTLDRGAWMRTGFNGMMMPVLEDSLLAARAAQGTFTVHDLLMYSAVCGTGLDTVPLPGDSQPEQIEALLLDVAALALRLNKPLLARLMPLPGKAAGDPTTFDFAYFAPGKVMSLPAAPLTGLLAGSEVISIKARPRA